jgi:hypothetical protein
MLGLTEIAIIAFFVLLVVIFIVGYTLPYWRQRDRKPGRVLKRGQGGEIAAIGDHQLENPLHLADRGTWSSKPILLAAGSYRLAYHFPAEVPVRVGLISSFDGEDTTLLIKSGSGVEGFELEGASYILQVQPADDSTVWQIELRRLWRPQGDDSEQI